MKRNLVLSVATVLVFFALVEAGLRLSGRVGTDALRSPDRDTLDRIPGLFDPEQDLIDRMKPSVPFHIHINSLGFRGREFPLARTTGVARILCVGDSYTFGAHVDDEDSFPAQLEKIFSAERGRPVEVINAGANGFTITDELLYLERKGLALQPDLIVLSFSQNDISDMGRRKMMIDSMREHADLKSTFLLGPALRFLQHTAVFNAMQRGAAWLKGPSAAQQATVSKSAQLWQRYLETFKTTVTLSRKQGVRFLLVIWPSAAQVAGTEPADTQEALTAASREMLLDSLDLIPVLRAIPPDGSGAFLVPLDGHPSARGHEAAARAVAATLSALLPSGTSEAAPK